MTSYRIVEHGEAIDPNRNYRVDMTDGTLYEVRFEMFVGDVDENNVITMKGGQMGCGEEEVVEKAEQDPMGR